MYLYGIDIAEYQSNTVPLDIAQVDREGFDFIGVKTSGSANAAKGTTYRDPWFTRHAAQVDDTDLIKYGYHYLAGHDYTPYAQAGLLFDICDAAGTDWGFCLDVEDITCTPALVNAFFEAWELITGGEKLLVYTSKYNWETKLKINLSMPSWAVLQTAHWIPEAIRGKSGTDVAVEKYASSQAKHVPVSWLTEVVGGATPALVQFTNHTLVASHWVDASVYSAPGRVRSQARVDLALALGNY